MNDKTFFDTVSEKREVAFAELDNNTFGPKIRNHLVQLFRKARAVDPGIEGVVIGMGGISIKGTFYGRYTDEPENVVEIEANDYRYKGGFVVEHSEVEDFLEACEDYDESGLACNVPVADITLDDLKTRSSEKAKVWRNR